MNKNIRVVYGDIKRESVLIDPSIAVSQTDKEVDQNNVIAKGESTGQILKNKYGKRQ
jgi:hypothetical protein